MAENTRRLPFHLEENLLKPDINITELFSVKSPIETSTPLTDAIEIQGQAITFTKGTTVSSVAFVLKKFFLLLPEPVIPESVVPVSEDGL